MAKKSKKSKNDMQNRNQRSALRRHNGHEVEAIKFNGQLIGLGEYMAGRYKDASKGDGLILDANNMPIAYNKFETSK